MNIKIGQTYYSNIVLGSYAKVTGLIYEEVHYLYNGTHPACCFRDSFEKEFTIPESVKIQPEIKTGLRYNQNKLRWRNFPMFLMKPLIEVAQYGETKYDTFNFLEGQTILDSLDSLKRHLEMFESPYESDIDESKCNHLAHVAWNALVALHMLNTRKDLDDRWKLPEQVELNPEEIQRRGR